MKALNLIRKTTTNKVAEVEKVVLETKTTEELVEEIHENFFTEVDKLLAEAKISHSLDTDKQKLIDKCERLKSLGFTNTKEVKDAEGEIKRLSDLKLENEKKKVLIEAIEYFSTRYPQYKFITEDSVLKICKKYNLVYGEISRYLGTVPEENLKHIERFHVDIKDECFVQETKIMSLISSNSIDSKRYLTNKEHKASVKQNEVGDAFSFGSFEVNMKCPLEIAAPVKDFNMEGMEVKDFKLSKIEIPDPVVLKPVIFKSQKHYLIVTAWGEEASDDIVVNEKMN